MLKDKDRWKKIIAWIYVTSALGRLRQEDGKIPNSLGKIDSGWNREILEEEKKVLEKIAARRCVCPGNNNSKLDSRVHGGVIQTHARNAKESSADTKESSTPSSAHSGITSGLVYLTLSPQMKKNKQKPLSECWGQARHLKSNRMVLKLPVNSVGCSHHASDVLGRKEE